MKLENLLSASKLAIIASFLIPILVILGEMYLRWNRPGFDFRQRLNEATLAISEGVDPYFVYSGKVSHPKYYPYTKRNMKHAIESQTEPVNGYTPWTYTYLFPLTKLPRLLAWRLSLCAGLFSLAVFFIWGINRGKAAGGDFGASLFCGCSALFLGMGPGGCIKAGNLDALVTPSIFLMIICLQRRREYLAGVFLALAMTKPQSALLFCVPLLIDRKWKPLLVGCLMSVFATIPPALACRVSPLSLVLDIPKFSADMAHVGSILIPGPLFSLLGNVLPTMVIMYLVMGVGAAVCWFLTWRLRNKEDWFLRFIPAAIWSTAWTYCTNRNVYFIPEVFLAMSLLQANTRKERIAILSGMGLLCSSGLMYFHSKCTDTIFDHYGLAFLSGRAGRRFSFSIQGFPLSPSSTCLSGCTAAELLQLRDGAFH